MPWLLMYVFLGGFFVIYMIAILCHTQEYFTYCTTPTRIIVETAQSLVKPRAIRKLLGDLPMGFKFNTWHFKSLCVCMYWYLGKKMSCRTYLHSDAHKHRNLTLSSSLSIVSRKHLFTAFCMKTYAWLTDTPTYSVVFFLIMPV